MELSCPKIKEVFIFSKTELCSLKNKKVQEETFRVRKIKIPALKKFLTFWEMELSSLKLKRLLYFRRELAKPEKQKFLIFLLTFFVF